MVAAYKVSRIVVEGEPVAQRVRVCRLLLTRLILMLWRCHEPPVWRVVYALLHEEEGIAEEEGDEGALVLLSARRRAAALLCIEGESRLSDIAAMGRE